MVREVRGRGDFSREVIISNISVKGGRLFEGVDYLRDGYYFRKYGIPMELSQYFSYYNYFLVFFLKV